MTKKDYCKFAEMVKYNLGNAGMADGLHAAAHAVGVADVARGMCDIFKADNPRFDRERFLKACGIE